MSAWLIVLTEDNWEVCKREQLLGVSTRASGKLSGVKPGDRMWIYISRRFVDRQVPIVRELRGVAEVTGSATSIGKPRWQGRVGDAFDRTVPFRLVREFRISGVAAVQELSTMRKYARWGALVQNAPVRLDDREVAVLERVVAE